MEGERRQGYDRREGESAGRRLPGICVLFLVLCTVVGVLPTTVSAEPFKLGVLLGMSRGLGNTDLVERAQDNCLEVLREYVKREIPKFGDLEVQIIRPQDISFKHNDITFWAIRQKASLTSEAVKKFLDQEVVIAYFEKNAITDFLIGVLQPSHGQDYLFEWYLVPLEPHTRRPLEPVKGRPIPFKDFDLATVYPKLPMFLRVLFEIGPDMWHTNVIFVGCFVPTDRVNYPFPALYKHLSWSLKQELETREPLKSNYDHKALSALQVPHVCAEDAEEDVAAWAVKTYKAEYLIEGSFASGEGVSVWIRILVYKPGRGDYADSFSEDTTILKDKHWEIAIFLAEFIAGNWTEILEKIK